MDLTKKRLGIFLIYDPDGIVDEYIEYLLDDISPLFARLIIVCNGSITPESRDILEKYTDSIFVRENRGFDFQGWKEAMFKYFGYSRVREYDELVLFNDSFFGPLRPFSLVFEEMEARKYDFWGLTVHGEVPTVRNLCPYGYRPRYIQTYFMVFNKRMLNDEEFIVFWKSMPVYSSFMEISEKCSAVLTKYFSDRGYRWGVYSDTSDLEESREKNICHHAFNVEELIVNRKYPVIKRKSFVLGKERYLYYNTGLDLPRAVKYIADNGLYDLDLIFRHIIRRYDVADIKESLNLSYVFDGKPLSKDEDLLPGQTIICIHIKKAGNVAVLLKYIQALQKSAAICVFADREASAQLSALRNKGDIAEEVKLVEYTGTYIECLILALNGITDHYKYMVFTHDMEFATDDAFVSDRAACELLWDNLISDKDYLVQFLCELRDNAYLGMLNPPPPMHGKHYTYSVNSKRDWNTYIEPWNQVLGDVIKDTDNPRILSVGCSFVCKTTALRNISRIRVNDYIRMLAGNEACQSAFDSILPYIVQKNGFLSGWCMNREYAETEIESARSIIENLSIPDNAGFRSSYMSFPSVNNVLKGYIAEQESLRAGNESLRMQLDQKDSMLMEKERQIMRLKAQQQMLLEYYRSLPSVQIRDHVSGMYHDIRRKLGLESSEEEE